MTTEKAPTQGERIEALEDEVAALKGKLDAIVKALVSGDPILTAGALAD